MFLADWPSPLASEVCVQMSSLINMGSSTIPNNTDATFVFHIPFRYDVTLYFPLFCLLDSWNKAFHYFPT